MSQIIVVGGGLAGLSAAHTILERGGNVLLLDKQGCVGIYSDLGNYQLYAQVHGRELYQGYVRH
jgi:glycine/D-amino acid oxidase-like deaminating enzyme